MTIRDLVDTGYSDAEILLFEAEDFDKENPDQTFADGEVGLTPWHETIDKTL